MNAPVRHEKCFDGVLLRRSAWLAVLAFLSRILGLVRDMGIAWLIGAGAGADMLLAAMRFPHFARRLLADGSLSMTLTSLFTGAGDPGSCGLYRAMRWRIAVSLSVITIFFIVVSPLVMDVLAPGFGGAELATAAVLLRICMPYVFTAGMAALGMSFLHYREHFLLPALSPIVFNMVLLLFTGVAAIFSGQAIWIIALGMPLAGACQWLMQEAAAEREIRHESPHCVAADRGVMFSAKQAWASVGVLPAGIIGASAPQLAMLCAMSAASEYGTGQISALYYAERLLEFPMALVVMGINMASLPALGRSAARGNFQDFERFFLVGMRWTLLLGAAAGAGLACVGPMLVGVLFEHGSFGRHAASITFQALLLLSPSLPIMGFSRCVICACNALGLFGISAASAMIALLAAASAAVLLPLCLPPSWPVFYPALVFDFAILAQALSLWGLRGRSAASVRMLLAAIPARYFWQPLIGSLATAGAAMMCRVPTWSCTTTLLTAVAAGAGAFFICVACMEYRHVWRFLRSARGCGRTD